MTFPETLLQYLYRMVHNGHNTPSGKVDRISTMLDNGFQVHHLHGPPTSYSRLESKVSKSIKMKNEQKGKLSFLVINTSHYFAGKMTRSTQPGQWGDLSSPLLKDLPILTTPTHLPSHTHHHVIPSLKLFAVLKKSMSLLNRTAYLTSSVYCYSFAKAIHQSEPPINTVEVESAQRSLHMIQL